MSKVQPNDPKCARAVLITGCSSGIGLASAKYLHSIGYRVIASARTLSDVDALNAQGLQAVLIDTADSNSIQDGVQQAIGLAGGYIYAVFHNAGYGQSGALEDLPVSAMRQQFDANVFGAHEINLILIPLMRSAGEGRIIWNSSVLGFFAMKYRGAYNASKFAIEGLADTLRLELMDSGIFTSLIEPGPIATDFRKNSLQAFERHIDPSKSVHAQQYKPFLARLAMVGNTSKLTLDAESVLPPLLDALESARPCARYRVTRVTKMMAVLKRLLPTSALDKIAMRGV